VGRLRGEHVVTIDRERVRYRNTGWMSGARSFEVPAARLAAVAMDLREGAVSLRFVTGEAQRAMEDVQAAIRDPAELIPEAVRGASRGEVERGARAAARVAGAIWEQAIQREIARLSGYRPG